MPIIEYDPNDASLLTQLAPLLPPHHSLRFRDFVDYYYGTSSRCRLLLMLNDDGEIQGTLGYEKMDFATPHGPRCFAHGSNFHAFESGAGGLLFLHWLKNCDSGIVLGGNANTQRVIQHQRWPRYRGVETLQLNNAYAQVPGEVWWRSLAKRLLRASPSRRRVDRQADAILRQDRLRVEVIPEQHFDDDMLPKDSPFELRHAPRVGSLNWRYNTALDFVRYRLFRITVAGQSSGYAVFNVQPRRVILSQCDAEDAWVLTLGIFAALKQLCAGRHRSDGVLLTSAHDLMKAAFREFGFRRHRSQRPLAIGKTGRQQPFADDTSNWLVNYDWGDNGLRAPFLGSPQIETQGRIAA